jgi:hypothetical protein
MLKKGSHYSHYRRYREYLQFPCMSRIQNVDVTSSLASWSGDADLSTGASVDLSTFQEVSRAYSLLKSCKVVRNQIGPHLNSTACNFVG